MVSLEEIKKCNAKIPENVFAYGINREWPFVFADFEVFKYDWMICFSIDGIHVKTIINDIEKLKDLFLNKLRDRILIAYNGNNYDKFIMSALHNGIDAKEANDHLINEFNFNFNFHYSDRIKVGKELFWYDPSSRLGGSLKTYEACEGENIYESEVDFNLDRKLTEGELKETESYCSFDVKMLIKYFYRENFDSFLGHIGLVHSTCEARPSKPFYQMLSKTDASLVGTYLCTKKGIDLTKDSDTIKLPDNIILGKYKESIEKFLETPIKTLKNGRYNGLNSWSIKLIDKSIAACETSANLDKLKTKEQKTIEKIKKLKLKLQELTGKEKLTAKQVETLNKIPLDMEKEKQTLVSIRQDIQNEETSLTDLKELKRQLDEHEREDFCNPNYNYILSKILDRTRLTDNEKINILINYLTLSKEELFKKRYVDDKKNTIYNGILIQYPFELILNIKGIPHLFKTGGIHSVVGKSLFFDKSTEHDRNRRLLIADVGSLYPNIMRVFGLCSIGMDDPNTYTQMIADRIVLKKQGDPFANVLKLILNTTYGCMGSEFNNLYDPTNRLKVCIFGQACIVDLLDKLEDNVPGLEIFQSNTDGIVISCENDEYELVESIIHEWENRTGLEMEIDESLYLAQRDVSNYILIEK